MFGGKRRSEPTANANGQRVSEVVARDLGIREVGPIIGTTEHIFRTSCEPSVVKP